MTVSNDSELIIRSNGVNEKSSKDNEDSISAVSRQPTSHPKKASKSSGSSSRSTSYRVVHSTGNLIRTIFPILSWVSYYPLKKYFLYGDLPAGVFIGLYLVPQCTSFLIDLSSATK